MQAKCLPNHWNVRFDTCILKHTFIVPWICSIVPVLLEKTFLQDVCSFTCGHNQIAYYINIDQGLLTKYVLIIDKNIVLNNIYMFKNYAYLHIWQKQTFLSIFLDSIWILWVHRIFYLYPPKDIYDFLLVIFFLESYIIIFSLRVVRFLRVGLHYSYKLGMTRNT